VVDTATAAALAAGGLLLDGRAAALRLLRRKAETASMSEALSAGGTIALGG